jgi:hypothetical protein
MSFEGRNVFVGPNLSVEAGMNSTFPFRNSRLQLAIVKQSVKSLDQLQMTIAYPGCDTHAFGKNQEITLRKFREI